MAKASAAAPSNLKKIAGIKVIVEGQYALKGDRRTDLARYEEFFFLRHADDKECLHIIRRFLITARLEAKHDQFKFVRTCGIKSKKLAEDIGLSALEKKGVDDMSGEETRTYCILKGYPRDIFEDIPVDFDVVERLKRYEADPKKWGKKSTAAEQELEDGPVGHDGPQANGEKWEDLDK